MTTTPTTALNVSCKLENDYIYLDTWNKPSDGTMLYVDKVILPGIIQ